MQSIVEPQIELAVSSSTAQNDLMKEESFTSIANLHAVATQCVGER